MGLFGKNKKEREKEYMNRLDVPLCLKEDFELIIDDVFTIMGVGTVATGNISTGMCREGENACVYKTNYIQKNENQMVVDIKQNMLDLG